MIRARAVHQLVPTFAPRDAIGGHILEVQRLVRGMGLRSEIYAAGVAAGAPRSAAHPLRRLAPRAEPGTYLMYQLSTGSNSVMPLLLQRAEPRLVNYHNITPAELFGPWEAHVGGELELGRRQLAELAPGTVLGLADSAYNEEELRAGGYPSTAVAPLLVDLEAFDGPADSGVSDRLESAKRKGGSDWLFVGRVAPHKCQHDIVKALVAYRQLYDPEARLHLVGGSSSHAYWTAIRRFSIAAGVGKAVELAGSVSHEALVAYYRSADVFVCLSDHEGFSAPLLEAMHHGVPVVALSAAAVPETLGRAGVLLPAKDPVMVAAAVHRTRVDASLRAQLAAAATERLDHFRLERSRERWVHALGGVLGDVA